jgi:hypothetical protein
MNSAVDQYASLFYSSPPACQSYIWQMSDIYLLIFKNWKQSMQLKQIADPREIVLFSVLHKCSHWIVLHVKRLDDTIQKQNVNIDRLISKGLILE